MLTRIPIATTSTYRVGPVLLICARSHGLHLQKKGRIYIHTDKNTCIDKDMNVDVDVDVYVDVDVDVYVDVDVDVDSMLRYIYVHTYMGIHTYENLT